MKVNLHFKGIEAQEHHRDYLIEEAKSSFGKFETTKPFTVDIYLKKEALKHKHSKEAYECEIKVRGERWKGASFFKKSAANYYVAIKKTMTAARKSIQRNAHCKNSERFKDISVLQAAFTA